MPVTAALDPFAPEHRADPYPVYQALYESGRLHWSEEQQTYFLTRYADCLELLRNPVSSVNSENGTMTPRRRVREAEEFRNNSGARPMLFTDPPDHTRLRGLVSKAFTPRAVEAMRPHIGDLVNRVLDRVEEKGELDVVEDVGFPLPVIVIAEMLGVPVEDQDQLKPWSRDMTRMIEPIITLEDVEIAGAAAFEFANYFNALIEERRASPGDDLLSGLITAEEEGEKLDHAELLVNLVLLFVAGHETTQNLIGNGMLALLRHPDQLAKLRDGADDPALVKNAVEEMLRYDPPVQLSGRHLTADAEVGGEVLPKGSTILTLLACANRDPELFDDPLRFDITRPNANRHVGFGHGIHHCLGAPLARVEAQVAIPAMLRRFPDLALATDDVRYRDRFTLRGPESLPVRI